MTKNKKMRRQQAIEATQRKKQMRLFTVLALLLVPLLIYGGRQLYERRQNELQREAYMTQLEENSAALREAALSQMPALSPSPEAAAHVPPPAVVFMSVSDTFEKASVFTGVGTSYEEAWGNAYEQTKEHVHSSGMAPTWLKADLVDSSEVISLDELADVLKPHRSEFFRKGLSLGTDFSAAFLEAELNGNGMIDYQEDALLLEPINRYLQGNDRNTIREMPQELVVFTTSGWFSDEEGTVFPLYGYEENGYRVGRRVLEDLTRETVEDVIVTSTEWLFNEIQEDGSFIYGYYPMFDERLTHYNILRHTVSIQPLIWYYAMTGDESLIPDIDSTLRYLVEDHIDYQNERTAYVVDRPNNEIKLGGNAVAIIALDLYMKTFETEEYVEVAAALGEGILALMDVGTGSYYHVLNPDFTPKEEYRTVYYDGEATYALALLYEMTGDEKWFQAASTAVEHFIRENYEQHRDHWVAYAVNEVTKHVPDPRYYAFALRNVSENLQAIYHRDTTYHTYLELLMASYELYHRIYEEGIPVEGLEDFDDAFYFETIFHRAEHMLNGYLYPEYSMYLANPQKYVGSFAVRHDKYRVRIDDVEHFIAGYYNVWRHYDQLRAYQDRANTL